MSHLNETTILDCIPNGYVYIQCEPLKITFLSKRVQEIFSKSKKRVSELQISELFQLDTEKQQLFESWVKVAARLINKQEWTKICAVAPIKSLEVENIQESKTGTALINYYPKTGNDKKLIGIAIEIVPPSVAVPDVQDTHHDITERENEVKVILSIANTPWDDMRDFVYDTAERINNLKTSIGELEDIYATIRSDFDNPSKATNAAISEQLQSIYIDTIFRHLHTIKGNALTYDFDELTQYSHEAETLANQLQQPASVRRIDVIKCIRQLMDSIEESFRFIISIFEKIYGDDEGRTIRLPLERIETIHTLCTKLEVDGISPSVNNLIKECETLSWKTLGSLTRKYSRVIYSRAVKMGKQIEFIVENSYTLVEPEVFKSIDESLLQIISNAVVHGIESNEIRCVKQKGPGQIRLSCKKDDKYMTVTVSDNGQGIRTDLLVDKLVKSGQLSDEASKKMTDDEKKRLIFHPRSSTAATVTKFAGRGVGMDVVENKIKLLGGTICVTSESEVGTKFIITIPVEKKD